MVNPNTIVYSSAKPPQNTYLFMINQGNSQPVQGNRYILMLKSKFCTKEFWQLGKEKNSFIRCKPCYIGCQSMETRKSDPKGIKRRTDFSNIQGPQSEKENTIKRCMNISSGRGLSEACKFALNDARIMNERARNDILLISQGIMSLDARARQDVSLLGSEFLKLDARAREDTEKIDNDVRRRAERLHHIATILKEKAQSRLKKAADKHWSNGALEADLKRADIAAKRRAMEDSLMALELVKDLHDGMVTKMCKSNTYSGNNGEGSRSLTVEQNGTNLPDEISADRINTIQEAYWSIAYALSEADGIDYTDPEELEFVVATLIDLDAMDGKSSVSLLAECSSSPDVSTRRALANALSTAPSMWTLGNAGVGALQRLSNDPNPTIAAAASKTIFELKKQWKIEEKDSWSLKINQSLPRDETDDPITD